MAGSSRPAMRTHSLNVWRGALLTREPCAQCHRPLEPALRRMIGTHTAAKPSPRCELSLTIGPGETRTVETPQRGPRSTVDAYSSYRTDLFARGPLRRADLFRACFGAGNGAAWTSDGGVYDECRRRTHLCGPHRRPR